MQIRDLIEQLQQFDPRSTVKFEITEPATIDQDAGTDTASDCTIKRGPDTCRICVEVS